MGKILSQEIGIVLYGPSSMVDPTIFSQFKKNIIFIRHFLLLSKNY